MWKISPCQQMSPVGGFQCPSPGWRALVAAARFIRPKCLQAARRRFVVDAMPGSQEVWFEGIITRRHQRTRAHESSLFDALRLFELELRNRSLAVLPLRVALDIQVARRRGIDHSPRFQIAQGRKSQRRRRIPYATYAQRLVGYRANE